MSYSVEKLPDDPIVLATFPRDFEFEKDALPLIQEVTDLLESSPVRLVYLADLTQSAMTFDEIAMAAEVTSRGENALFHHPKIKAIVFVTSREIFHKTAEGMKSDTYGHVSIKMFDAMDDAMTFSRSV